MSEALRVNERFKERSINQELPSLREINAKKVERRRAIEDHQKYLSDPDEFKSVYERL